MAPEYLYRGEISTWSYIYSLGVVIMEITTGEKNFSGKQDMSARDFVDKARPRLENIFFTCLMLSLKLTPLNSVGA